MWAASGAGHLAWDIVKHMILPIATLTLISFAGTMLLTRNSMLEVIREDHVLAARAKGLPDKTVRDRHVARNALLPVVTSFVFSLAFAIDGGVIIESIFSWPGMGQTLVAATVSEDLPLAVGAFVFVGTVRAAGPPGGRHPVRLPGSAGQVLMAAESSQVAAAPSLWRVRLGLAARGLNQNWSLFLRTRIGLLGLAIILFYMLLALAHPILLHTVWDERIYDPVIGYAFDETEQPAPPSLSHPLGTDPLGRDILSQLMFSARSEFLLGLLAAVVTVCIGTMVGAVAAYFGGWIDMLLMRLADIMIMMPGISILIVLSALIEVGHLELALLIGILSGFGGTGVVLKSQALSVVVKPYIEAARTSGGGTLHIILVHVVPNLLPLSFLYMMFTVTSAIFSEAVLSFLGLLDVRMSWGLMIHTTESAGYLLQVGKYWWLIFPASLSITLLCSSFYLLGRSLDEVVNPRLRAYLRQPSQGGEHDRLA